MAQVTVKLKDNEKAALVRLAEREAREPEQQARLIIRRDLEQAGLLEADKPINQPQEPAYASAGAN